MTGDDLRARTLDSSLRPLITAAEAFALADLIDAATAAAEDLGDCGDGGWGAGATCRSVFPDNSEEWCGTCLLHDALAALDADR